MLAVPQHRGLSAFSRRRERSAEGRLSGDPARQERPVAAAGGPAPATADRATRWSGRLPGRVGRAGDRPGSGRRRRAASGSHGAFLAGRITAEPPFRRPLTTSAECRQTPVLRYRQHCDVLSLYATASALQVTFLLPITLRK